MSGGYSTCWEGGCSRMTWDCYPTLLEMVSKNELTTEEAILIADALASDE